MKFYRFQAYIYIHMYILTSTGACCYSAQQLVEERLFFAKSLYFCSRCFVQTSFVNRQQSASPERNPKLIHRFLLNLRESEMKCKRKIIQKIPIFQIQNDRFRFMSFSFMSRMTLMRTFLNVLKLDWESAASMIMEIMIDTYHPLLPPGLFLLVNVD